MKSHKNQKNQKVLGSKPINVGKELVKRIKNLNNNIETIMPKPAKPKLKSESFPINADGLVMYLYDTGDNANRYVSMDFNDYSNYDKFYMILDRPTLKGMADFINNYLENE